MPCNSKRLKNISEIIGFSGRMVKIPKARVVRLKACYRKHLQAILTAQRGKTTKQLKGCKRNFVEDCPSLCTQLYSYCWCLVLELKPTSDYVWRWELNLKMTVTRYVASANSFSSVLIWKNEFPSTRLHGKYCVWTVHLNNRNPIRLLSGSTFSITASNNQLFLSFT